MRNVLNIFLALFLFCNITNKIYGQTKPAKTRVLFVFDASNSMKSKYLGLARIDHAKGLAVRLLDSLSKIKNYEFALRMYGSQVPYPPGSCEDSKLIVPFGPNNLAKIKQAIMASKPTGTTPIEHSLIMSADDFPKSDAVNTIILITDGIEECKGDPCAARAKLLEKNIVFKPCIIGIGLTVEQAKTFDCVGQYFSYENRNVVENVVNTVENQVLNKTSEQVNLLSQAGEPTETNVNMTFYNTKDGAITYNYVHTMNTDNVPDTMYLNVGKKYDVTVHTIPPVEIRRAEITLGKHNIFATDAPQGKFKFVRPKSIYKQYDEVKALIHQRSEVPTLHVQTMNSIEKYIVGLYDVEVLTLPKTILKAQTITQSNETVINIAAPGKLVVLIPEAGDGCILQEKDGKLEWVVNLDKTQMEQTYYLQPGEYRVTYRSKRMNKTIYTVDKKVSIKTDKEARVVLYQ